MEQRKVNGRNCCFSPTTGVVVFFLVEKDIVAFTYLNLNDKHVNPPSIFSNSVISSSMMS